MTPKTAAAVLRRASTITPNRIPRDGMIPHFTSRKAASVESMASLVAATGGGDPPMDFSDVDALPDRAFFPREFVAQYKRQVSDLVVRVEQLVEHVDELEVESEPAAQYDGVRLATLSRETLWHNLAALHDCALLVREASKNLQQRVRESVDMVETHPAMERTISNSSIPVSEYSSDGGDETDEDALPAGFQDVVPVKSKKEAIALNNDVTSRVQAAIGSESEFEVFKTHALDFGTGKETADEFYGYLYRQISSRDLDSIVVDFARLLPQPAMRIPLLKAHYWRLERESGRASISQFRNKSYSSSGRSRLSSAASSDAEYDTDDGNIDEYPSTVRLPTINHLVFVIHGIGQHIDFREGELKSWNGETGMEGGNHAFRDLFRVMLETTFRDIPLALEMQSIEWHEDLHEPTGVDNVFDLIAPEGSSVIREFSKETLMDIMYYLSPRYGQLIVDTVTQQMNEKYHIFKEEHPGWDGKVSIFAHSLGSLISYDLLTHGPGEIGHNGIRFPGLEFDVDIFFGVGSPVAVMVLGRGDLNFEDGNFIPGIKMPRCRRYYNIFHPIDPIAYRVEPLMKQEMHDKDPVQLIQASTVRGHTFGQIQEMWEAINGPVHGFAYRHDYVMKRRKREQGMMEIAFASASHSSYWMSDDVVLFTLMQLCEPVVELLHKYMSARLPLPTLMRNIVELKPHTRVMLSATALVRDRCTSLSREQIVLIDPERLFFLPRLGEVACRRKWRLPLTPGTRAMYGEDSFTLKVVPGNKPAPPSSSGAPNSSRPPQSSGPQQDIYILKAPTTPIRDEWMHAINNVVLRLEEEQQRTLKQAHQLPRDSCNFVEVPAGRSIDYFNAVKAGFLHEKSLKGWMEGWSNRWIVLQEDHLSCYENSPRLDFSGQFKLRRTTAYCYDKDYLIRVVSRRGTAVEMRVKNQDSFNHWIEAFGEIRSVKIVRHEELLENSPSAVLLMTGSSRGSISSNGKVGEWIQTKIEGHQMTLDEKDLPYAAFVIHVASSTSGASVVHRRYSEFAKLHRHLRKIIPPEKMPALPGTRIWNKFDPTYLKEKAIGLHGYLTNVCKLCANTRAQPVLMEFLELAPPSKDSEESHSGSDSNGTGRNSVTEEKEKA